MSNGVFTIPPLVNEPVDSFKPGSAERITLLGKMKALKNEVREIPMIIAGQEITTGQKGLIHPPHERHHLIGEFHRGDETHVKQAIDAALKAKPAWENLPWEERAAVFLKAADLLTGSFRAEMNAATMLCQSKNAFQSEIDAVCELADFFRFNALFMQTMYEQQPLSAKQTWNKLEYRALEGFVFAITPFNFTSIAGNLPSAPAIMGNTVVWKPAETQIYSAYVIMKVFQAAGLPPGVINLVFASGPMSSKVVLNHPEFSGIHFTGSTGVFQTLWKTIGSNINNYRSYPRIVGETGGKDFVLAHPSADPVAVAVALARGAFEYQGQKCSAASRAYIPRSLYKSIRERLVHDVQSFKMGSPENFSNFINAVIDEKAFDNITNYIARAKLDPHVKILAGGGYDKSEGYFIEPTILQVDDPRYVTMCEELFGPVLTLYVYDDQKWRDVLILVDTTSPYALTGAIFAQDRYVIQEATQALRHSAGNFYINDKPTGAVVGQQPFGGARASGTNDKAGSILNLYRWVSPRTIKENFDPPLDFRYPFLAE